MKNKKTKHEQYPKKTISIEGMDLYTLCRWASLKDAVDIIGEKCEDKKIDFNTFDVKPLDLLKYVDSMTDELYYKVMTSNDEN
jgi:hypothetical protein